MRRKSGRSGRSPDKTESSRKSHRQSSRKHKRSSSRSSVESDDGKLKMKEPAQHINNNPTEDDKANSVPITGDEKSHSPIQESKGKLSGNETLGKGSSNHGSPLIKNSEDSQDREMGIEEMEEKNIKGKSKGKNKSNIEQSSNIIEPEIENENVQGTPQSPSNDNADNENVQNVNDTAKNDGERQEEIQGECGATTKEQISTESDVTFESEYTRQSADINCTQGKTDHQGKENKPEESSEDLTEKSGKSNESNISRKSFTEKDVDSTDNGSFLRSSKEERSMTPELKENVETGSKNFYSSYELGSSINKSSEQNSQEKTNGENSSKKKIILRRSPLINSETDKSEDVSLCKEKKLVTEESGKDIEQEKPRKKITLKRNNIDERMSNEEKGSSKTSDESNKRLSTNEDQVEKKRRFSGICEHGGQDGEDKPKRNLKKIKLIRRFSPGNDESHQETTKQLSTLRRHMWNRSGWLDNLTFYNVDVDSIKIVCPSLTFLGEDELHLETTPRERRKSESDFKRKVSVDKSDDSDRPDYEKQISEESLEQKIELNPNIIAMNRKISIVDDTASKLRPPPSPSKHPVSDILYITNLVRPFTVKQLKELLERTGKIKPDGFWTDRIKSKCYVHYESIEDAEATRNALHGVHWPIGNGKQLIIDYATVEDLEKAKNPAPAPKPVEKVPEKENREPAKIEEKFRDREREEKEERKRKDGAVREWDLGKEGSRRGRSRTRSRERTERTRKHSRRSYTPEITEYIHRKQRKMEEPVPQKLMDDLFLKTKATPSIYWQPLSPEEIAMKQKQRLVRMEEHKRRIEETRVRLRDNRRGSFRRR